MPAPSPSSGPKSADDVRASIKRFCLATLNTAKTQILGKTPESGH